MLKIFTFIAILFIISFRIHGQNAEKRFRRFTIDQGLSQNMVNAIFQDHRGFMWFGTKDGLNRYDGYIFKVYKTDPSGDGAISDNHVTAIYEDDRENLWVGTRMGGLNLYDAESDSFRKVTGDSPEEGELLINSITGNSESGLWISSVNGYVTGYDIVVGNRGEICLKEKARFGKSDLHHAVVESLGLDQKGVLWMATDKGLRQLDTRKKKLVRETEGYPVFTYLKSGEGSRTTQEAASPLTTALTDVLIDDENNTVWLFCHNGAYRLDKEKRRFGLYGFGGWMMTAAIIKNRESEVEIWASTYEKELLICNTSTLNVRRIPGNDLMQGGVLDGLITTIFRSKNGNIWMGTNGRGVIYYSPTYNLFTNSLAGLPGARSNSIYSIYPVKNPGEEKSVLFSTLLDFAELTANGKIRVHDGGFFARAIQEDRSGNLWIGSNDGLMIYDKKTRRKQLIDSSAVVSWITINYNDNVWYTTTNSLRLYRPRDRTTRDFTFNSYLNKNKHSVKEGLYSTIQPDPDGSLWIGTVNGLYRFDPEKEAFTALFENDPSDYRSISSNEIKSLLPDPSDPENILWVGTMAGLNKLDKKTGTFEYWGVAEGLPNNTVYGILPDSKGQLWLSTNRGLSAFHIQSKTFTNYDVSNGLQSNEFNTGAYFKAEDGELFFGGIDGLTRFYPDQISISGESPPIVISDIGILAGPGIPQKNFSLTRLNTLRYDQNNINILLAALDYSAPEKIRYAYRIANQDTNWIPLGNNRRVALTNLSAGKYTFQARGTDSFGRWSDELAEVQFSIAPPWWNSLAARLLYLLALAVGLYFLWTRNRLRLEATHRLESEKRQAAAILELDRVKSRFLANITHEFRTPLTLISGHIERLKSSGGSAETEQQYTSMERNSQHLLRLINQLMDLSKMESGEYRLRYKKAYLLNDLKPGVFAFHSYAERKNIRLTLEILPETEVQLSQNEIVYAPEALDTILKNLLSNACKFAEEDGFIHTSVHYSLEEKQFKISVTNSGPEISPEDLPRLFDRFFQSDAAHGDSYEGSGIGLSLVKELAVLHGGNVTVASTAEAGTTFTVLLKEGNPDHAEHTHSLSEPYTNEFQPASDLSTDISEELPLVLVVEDHDELRRFIRDSLGSGYHFAEAVNGTEGFRIAEEIVPDLIISDVMMPGMDGFELCRQLKNKETTSHIPVVLLTARATTQDKLDGLETGADDYLTKPFSPTELTMRIRNMIKNRQFLHKKYSETRLTAPGEEPNVPSSEKAFVKKLENLIGSNLSDPAFRVEVLATIIHLSTSQLNRKVKAITGKTTVSFIREHRMLRALELLRSGENNVTEVAFGVGFEDPGYFAKVFRNYFGFLPSDKERVDGGKG